MDYLETRVFAVQKEYLNIPYSQFLLLLVVLASVISGEKIPQYSYSDKIICTLSHIFLMVV